MQLRSGNCLAVVTQLLLLSLSPWPQWQFWPGDTFSSCVLLVHVKHLDSRGSWLLPWCPQDSEKWLLSVFTLLCLAKALICREGTRTCCQRADNTALIYMLFASVKFSIAAMDPFVFSLHFCFVLKILITFTKRQQNFFPILCYILEFF